MRIVYLDEPTYLPESFIKQMRELGQFDVFFDRPDKETAIRRLSEADVAIVEWTHLDAEILRRVERIRYITLALTSYDYVDLAVARERGIQIAHCPTYSMQSVAEHVFALLLAVNRKILQADAMCRQGISHQYLPLLSTELAGRTFGMIGSGRIAQAAAKIARGFGMRVVATNKTGRAIPGIEWVPLPEVFRQSDVVSLHLPTNAETEGIITAELLGLMKPAAFLINTCRGRLIDEAALYRMLCDRKIAGAGLDDLARYENNPLYSLPNVVLTPGSAWYTEAAREANMEEMAANIRSYLHGQPTNLITGNEKE